MTQNIIDFIESGEYYILSKFSRLEIENALASLGLDDLYIANLGENRDNVLKIIETLVLSYITIKGQNNLLKMTIDNLKK